MTLSSIFLLDSHAFTALSYLLLLPVCCVSILESARTTTLSGARGNQASMSPPTTTNGSSNYNNNNSITPSERSDSQHAPITFYSVSMTTDELHIEQYSNWKKKRGAVRGHLAQHLKACKDVENPRIQTRAERATRATEHPHSGC